MGGLATRCLSHKGEAAEHAVAAWQEDSGYGQGEVWARAKARHAVDGGGFGLGLGPGLEQGVGVGLGLGLVLGLRLGTP